LHIEKGSIKKAEEKNPLLDSTKSTIICVHSFEPEFYETITK